MSDRRLTLTDVMLGIDKHGLVCKLSEESFTFLIGIILEHNKRGFRMPFDLNNQQAMAAGGGNTPKSVRRRRATLCKFKIDGKPLLKVISGNYGRNTCAKYEINYKSLMLYNGIWSGETMLPTQIWDSRGESSGYSTRPSTRPHPKIREEEKRSGPPAPQIPNTTQEDGKAARADGLTEDSEEDWITYVIDIMKKPNEQFPEIDLIEKATWLVKHNDLVLIEECYDAFQQIPIADVRNRPAFFMSMIEKRGGEVIR